MTTETTSAHPQLVELQTKLQAIHDEIANFHPPLRRIPILDSSLNIQLELNSARNSDAIPTGSKEGKEHSIRDEWTVQGQISGLKKLKDTIRIDLDVLEKFLKAPTSSTLPPLSTNAPYLIAVWNEVLAAQHDGGVKAVFKTFLLEGDERAEDDKGNDSDQEAPKGGKRKTKGARSDQEKKKTKVDVVSNGGTHWVRVNTIKNNRLLSELREIDSYVTDSESDDENDYGNRPSLRQKSFDNSVLRMGHALIQTAKNNAIRVGRADQRIVPQVTLRLTRLDPVASGIDARVQTTVDMLRDLGLTVEIGERDVMPLPLLLSYSSSSPPPPSSSLTLKPTQRVNLDLSVLIALVSDLTHSPLPSTVAEAKQRYVPPPAERDWKKPNVSDIDNDVDEEEELDTADKELKEKRRKQREDELLQHSRALTNQVLQEMGKSMITELRDRLLSTSSLNEVEFWTTTEARDRCIRIVSKIGGEQEQRRVLALFDGDAQTYWDGSRFSTPDKMIPIMPLRYYDGSPSDSVGQDERTPFFHALERTCDDILGEDGTGGADPHPIYANASAANPVSAVSGRAVGTKFNPRLTAHTVRTILWGAKQGWTTLTANRTSVRAVVREVGRASLGGLGGSLEWQEKDKGKHGELEERAAIWVLDPRSLAEGMRNDGDVATQRADQIV